MQTDAKLERQGAPICDPPREKLAALWLKAYGCPPPKGITRASLERAAAWHLQAKRLGGLSAHARRIIRQHLKQREAKRDDAAVGLGSGHAATAVVPTIKPPPAPGTRLMREWNGRMHVVDITEDGILFDGKLYRSLTAVAKRITGAHWSGPRFFGL